MSFSEMNKRTHPLNTLESKLPTPEEYVLLGRDKMEKLSKKLAAVSAKEKPLLVESINAAEALFAAAKELGKKPNCREIFRKVVNARFEPKLCKQMASIIGTIFCYRSMIQEAKKECVTLFFEKEGNAWKQEEVTFPGFH